MWKGFRHLKNPITSSKNLSSKIKAVERYYKFILHQSYLFYYLSQEIISRINRIEESILHPRRGPSTWAVEF